CQIGIAKTLTDVCGFGEFRRGIRDVAAHHRLARGRHQKVSALHSWIAALVKQPRGTRHPAGSLSGITHAHQDGCNPRSDPTSLTELAPLNESLMRANQHGQTFAVFADEIR